MAQTAKVSRDQLAQFIKDPATLRAFELMAQQATETPEAVAAAQATADSALTLAGTASAAAGAAQSTANTGVANAAIAQSTANTALTNAATAQSGVNALTAAQSANRVYAGPASGGAATPSFRALTLSDLPVTPNFSANRGGTGQTIGSTGAFVKVQCGTEEWDVGSRYDSTVNYRFTPNVAGKYRLTATACMTLAAVGQLVVSIFKNGVEYRRGGQIRITASSYTVQVIADVLADGVSDYFEMFVYQDTGVNATLNGGAAESYFQGAFSAP